MTNPELNKHRYVRRFARLRQQGEKAFIPFTLLGWPNRETSLAITHEMIKAGVTALELGLAFSDPVADGPVIQQASLETLKAGFKVKDALALLRDIRALDDEIPIGLLVYFNMVLARGPEVFFRELYQAGADAVLIVDLPPEMGEEVITAAHRVGLDLIFIVSPLTQEARLPLIAANAGGFLYAVSRLGITGVEERYDQELQEMLRRVKAKTDLPVCVGFGISTPEQGRKMIEQGADGFIVGSRIIQLMREAAGQPPEKVLAPYLQSMMAVTRAPLGLLPAS